MEIAREFSEEWTKPINGRNLEGFVEDMMIEGLNESQIIQVAQHTCWKHRIPQLRKLFRTKMKKFKKR